MQTYAPPKLSARQMAAVERGEYDFLIPNRRGQLRTDEVASIIGRREEFVRRLGDEGRLERHRDSALSGGRPSGTYTRRSVLLYLAETSDYEPSFAIIRVEAVLKTFGPAQLDRVIAFCTRQKNLIR